MTLQQFRFRIQRQFDLSPSSGDERGLIDQWVNQVILDFSRRAKVNLQTTTMNLTIGSGDYQLSQDVLAFDDVWVDPATGTQQNRMLQAVDSSEIRRMRLLQGAISAGVMYYAIEGENLFMIYPNADSSSDTVNIIYVPKPTALSAIADTPATEANGNIPEEFHYVLLDGVKAEAADFKGDVKSADYYRERYEQGIERARAESTRKGGLVIGAVRIGRPTWQVPLSPGVDLGG